MSFVREEIERIAKGTFIGGNEVELLWRGQDAFGGILEAAREAKESICLQFYIFRDDETGETLADIIKEKARQGVKVHVLYDHLGSFGTPRSFWRSLEQAGVKVRASRPFSFLSPRRYTTRDHRKLMIIDGKEAFTGGLNIANEYRGLRARRKEPWRDTGIILKGPVAGALMQEFVKAWNAWGREPLARGVPAAIEKQGSLLAMPIFARSARGRRKLRRVLYYSINHASEDIALTTAYFSPSRRLLDTLEEAVRRGVRVRLLLPGISDVASVQYVGRAFFGRLLASGVEIYTYMHRVLHAKTYIFDDAWCIVGSANLDFRSLRRNDEGNVGILDRGFARRMAAMFAEDLEHSRRVRLEDWQRRPHCEKAKEKFYSLFRRRL
jgi:cardiolipin synthase